MRSFEDKDLIFERRKWNLQGPMLEEIQEIALDLAKLTTTNLSLSHLKIEYPYWFQFHDATSVGI